MFAIGKLMHIDRTNQIPVPGELAFAAHPIAAFGFVLMPTCRTATRCSSFRTGGAHDVDSLRLVSEIINVFAIFPQSHTLIVVSAIVLIAHSMRVANEEAFYLMLNTEIDHFASGFMSQVTNAPFSSTALLVFRMLKSLPAAGVLLATGLLFGDLAQLFVSLTFERTDGSPSDDHSSPSIGGYGSQMDLAEVYGGLDRTGSLFGLWSFYTDMQFEAIVPDQAASTTVFWQVDWQDKRSTPTSHRQHHTPMLFADRLSGPLDGIKAFGTPGVLHLHLWMRLTELACGLYVGKECGHNHLYRLTMQCKTSFSGLLQCITSRPRSMVDPCSFMYFHTTVPHLCRFHLSSFKALKLFVRQVLQLIDFHRLHEENCSMKRQRWQVGKPALPTKRVASHLV